MTPEEAMTELPSIPERVEKGIAWLEERGAYDWAEKIVAAVDESRFNMHVCTRCAVGVSLGDYYDYFYRPDPDENVAAAKDAERIGFTVLDDQDRWEPLEAEWERKAREHAAWRAEVLG